ncbi:acyltransferase family protein [Thermostilla marina]
MPLFSTISHWLQRGFTTGCYRPSIDGMRCIAVLGVLLFHFNKAFLPGGFVGVDVFFVISGYLITSIVYRECQSGVFSLARFYQRRITRIFPVLLATIAVTLAAASYIYSPQDFASAGAVATAASLSLANVKFMLQGNYFELSPDAQPFLHFWSLSVEEQFYVFLPLFLVLTTKSRLTAKQVLGSLLAISLASFLGCVLLTQTNPTWAFYLLPTRAWELLAGAALAVFVAERKTPLRYHSSVALLGLAMILLSFAFLRESNSFPGFVAALPVIGTVLLIGWNPDSSPFTERVLAHPALVYVGKLSYSLYLWHWPIFCFVDYHLFAASPPVRWALKICLMLLVSTTSYYVLEQPARRLLNRPHMRSFAYAGFAVATITLTLVGYSVRMDNYINASVDTIAHGGRTFSTSHRAPHVVLMGDSEASMYGIIMKKLATLYGINVNVISVAGGNPFPGNRQYEESIRFLAETRPDVTVFVAAWASRVDTAGFEDNVKVAVEEILKYSSHVILISQPPILPKDASRASFRKTGMHPVCEEERNTEKREKARRFLDSLESKRVHVVHVDDLFLDEQRNIRFCDEHGHQLFHDRIHLSGFGAAYVESRVLNAVLAILETNNQRQPESTVCAKRLSSSDDSTVERKEE